MAGEGEILCNNYAQYSLAQLYAQVNGGQGVVAVQPAVTGLAALAPQVSGSAQRLARLMDQAKVSWQGHAAEAAGSAVQHTASWVGESGRVTHAGGDAVGSYSSSWNALKSRVPAPAPVPPATFWGTVSDLFGAHSDHATVLAANENTRQNAIVAMQHHEDTTRAAVSGFVDAQPLSGPGTPGTDGDRAPHGVPPTNGGGAGSSRPGGSGPTPVGPAAVGGGVPGGGHSGNAEIGGSPGGGPAGVGPLGGASGDGGAGGPGPPSFGRPNDGGPGSGRPDGAGAARGSGTGAGPSGTAPAGYTPPTGETSPNGRTSPNELGDPDGLGPPRSPGAGYRTGAPGLPPLPAEHRYSPGSILDALSPQRPTARAPLAPTRPGPAELATTTTAPAGRTTGAGPLPMGAARAGGHEREHRNNTFLPSDEPFTLDPGDEVVPPVLGPEYLEQR